MYNPITYVKCVGCSGRLIIDPRQNNNISKFYFTLHEDEQIDKCALHEYLLNTDHYWNIKTLNEYVSKLHEFFQSNECKTLIKIKILKTL